MTDEQKFHKSRIMFAVMDVLLIQPFDERDRYTWLEQDFGWSKEVIDKTVVGYIRPVDGEDGVVNIVYYAGEDFHVCPPLSSEVIDELLETAVGKFHPTEVRLWTGVTMGKVGEVWQPIELVETYSFV